jgi:STE24 endopeptidase
MDRDIGGQMKSFLAALVVLSAIAPSLNAQAPSAPAAGVRLDPGAATRAYLNTVPPDKKAKSDAYFEGGYWLILWDFLAGAAAAILLLSTRLSARMRDVASRITRWRALQTWIYWVQYLLAVTIILFPMTVYEGFFREHEYGLSNQAFGPWLGDQGKGLLVGLLLGGLAVTALYAVLRRAPRTWWLWGSLTILAFLVFAVLIAPVYIAPLFNRYTRLADPRIEGPILSMARANGIGVSNVYEFDASRQSKRVSANVSGFLGTERISLNDNLLNRCTLPEIEAVMGHEMGHYVLHHVYKGILFFGVVVVVGFALVRWAFAKVLTSRGARWGVRGVEDPAGLPLLVLLISIYLFLLTPVLNTYSRTDEAEADLFGLNAARQPDGMATVSLKLAEYRKLDPGPVEEFVFYDHPSGRNRILMAMRWKAENAR